MNHRPLTTPPTLLEVQSQPDPLTIAYLAGVIDSDGYITIHRSVRKGRLYHCARIGIAGTSREPHDLASSLWGGNVGVHFPRNPLHRPQFQWSRSGDDVMAIVESIYPHLRVKRGQAELALELQEHVLCGRGDDPFPWFGPDYDPIPHRESLRAQVVLLMTRRGRAAA